MTGPNQPIATTYVEVRTARNAKQDFKRDVEETVQPAARGVSQTMQQAIREGLRTPAGAAGAGAAIGTLVGQGISRAMHAALRGGTSIFRIGVAEVKDYQAGLSQLESGLRSTGGVAGLTAKQMEALASAVQEYSGQTDDSIVRAESLLLTFDKIRDTALDKTFTRATKAAADLSARGFGSVESEAIQLGKALQDPVRGMTSLARSGITFTEQQRATIKSLAESGRTLEAQKIILGEVEKQVGGSAKAYGETLPGQVDRAHRSFEDLSQSLLGTAAPALEATAKGARAIVTAVDGVGPVLPILIGVGGALVVATKAVKTYREIRDTLFARQGERIAGNLAEARSIDAIAAAEVRAGGAGVAAARTGAGAAIGGAAAAAGGAAASRGLLGRLFGSTAVIGTAAGGGRIATGIGAVRGFPVGVGIGGLLPDAPEIHHGSDGLWHAKDGRKFRRDGNRLTEVFDTTAPAPFATGTPVLAAQERLARSRAVLARVRAARLDPRTLIDNGVIGGAFDAVPDRHPNDVAAAREQLREANRTIADAQRALADARAGGPGASHAQIASAQASVLTARDAVHRPGGNSQAEQLRLEAAESRLADLRAKGGTNADKVREAEDKLAAARRDAGKATKDLHEAEKGTALSADDVLKRITGQASNARALREDAKTLIKKGVSEPVLVALEDLEKTAPGTLDNLAKSLTPAMAKALNAQQAGLAKATYEFHDAARIAGINDAIAAVNADKNDMYAKLAAAQIERYKKAITDKLDREAGPSNPPEKPDPHEHAPPKGGPHVNRSQAPDPNEHGAPKTAPTAAPAVHVTLTGVRAQTVHSIAHSAIAQADKNSAALVSTGVL